jgi:hypothetical protein
VTYVADALAGVSAELPDLDSELVQLYALLALVKGEATSLADVHDAWALWRHRTRPEHPSIVPFEQLSAEVQELDRPYADGIRRVAKALRG